MNQRGRAQCRGGEVRVGPLATLPDLFKLMKFVLIVFACLPISAQTNTTDSKFLDDTRNAYSMLRRQGLIELRASVSPNWEPLLANLKPERKPAALKLAKRLRFSIDANADGNIHVTHTIYGPKPNKATANALDTMAKGVELSVTGFLMSWVPFMLTHLIPEKLDHFVLQHLDSERVLTFKDGQVDVTITITNDFEIKELRTLQGTIKPILKRTTNGFVLAGYDGNNDDPYVGHVELKATVDLQETQGLLLPKTVLLKGFAVQTPINFELHFTNYRLKRRI
jgi:hypothetical protein